MKRAFFSLATIAILSLSFNAKADPNINICNGFFTGFYQGLSYPLSMNLSSHNYYDDDVTVAVAYHGKTWSGRGTCHRTSFDSAEVNLFINGAPNHYGNIYIEDGNVIFTGTQNPGYPFTISHPINY